MRVQVKGDNMEDDEIEEIMSGKKELYMKDVFRLMVDLNTKV